MGPQKMKMEPQSDEESNEKFSLSGTIRAMNMARSLEIGQSNFPYRVDYGDGYGTVCKMCMKNFDTGEIRLRINNKTIHDKYHAKCFFVKYQPKNVGEIAQYNLLRLIDQQVVREMLQFALV